MASSCLEVDSDPLRKRTEFNPGLLHPNFLAVELFSESRGLPHIPSHFVWSSADQLGSARQHLVCRLQLLRASSVDLWDLCQQEVERLWASGVFRVSWQLKQDVWSFSYGCRCSLGSLADPFVD